MHVAPRSLLGQPSLKAPGPSERPCLKQQGRQLPMNKSQGRALAFTHMCTRTHTRTPCTHTIRGEKISFTSLLGNLTSCVPYPYFQALWASGAKLRAPPSPPQEVILPFTKSGSLQFPHPPQANLGGQVGRPLFLVSAQ